jgi:hypothetical protein
MLPRMRLGGAVSSLRWAGAELPIGAPGQLPAALMHRPMMGPAQQREVGQVGRATSQPGHHMMSVAPGQGRSQSGTTQPPSRTAKALRWAGVTTRVARPTSRGVVAAPPRTRGSRARAARKRAWSPTGAAAESRSAP